MKLVDADLLSSIVHQLKGKYGLDMPDGDEYWRREFEIFEFILDNIREASAPEYKAIYSDHGEWIRCDKELPPSGVDVILAYKDTYHTHESWPRFTIKPAWIANVGEESTPNGEWAIEGRLGDYCISLEDGLAWMPLPAYSFDIDNREVATE